MTREGARRSKTTSPGAGMSRKTEKSEEFGSRKSGAKTAEAETEL